MKSVAAKFQRWWKTDFVVLGLLTTGLTPILEANQTARASGQSLKR